MVPHRPPVSPAQGHRRLIGSLRTYESAHIPEAQVGVPVAQVWVPAAQVWVPEAQVWVTKAQLWVPTVRHAQSSGPQTGPEG